MTRLYLITGFLGAGKTSFLKKFAPLFPDKRIALIINEFGANSVDGSLLRDVDAALKEIDNGSIFCSCRAEQFEASIIEIMEARNPDYIFVEASGLSDPTMVKTIFSQSIYDHLIYAGAICLVDAARFHKVYRANRVSRMQLAVSDLVLVNKTDLATREQIDSILEIVQGQKPDRPVFETTHGEFKREWLEQIDMDCLSDGEASEALYHVKDVTLSKFTLSADGFTLNRFESFLKMFADETYRIKGFMIFENQKYVVDCVGPIVEVRPWDGDVVNPGQIVVLYGNGLHAKSVVKEAMGWFEDCEIVFVKT